MLFSSLLHKSRKLRSNNFRSKSNRKPTLPKHHQSKYNHLLQLYEQQQSKSITLHAQISFHQDEITQIAEYLHRLEQYYNYNFPNSPQILPTYSQQSDFAVTPSSPPLSNSTTSSPLSTPTTKFSPDTPLFDLIKNANTAPREKIKVLYETVKLYKNRAASLEFHREQYENTISNLETRTVFLRGENDALKSKLEMLEFQLQAQNDAHSVEIQALLELHARELESKASQFKQALQDHHSEWAEKLCQNSLKFDDLTAKQQGEVQHLQDQLETQLKQISTQMEVIAERDAIISNANRIIAGQLLELQTNSQQVKTLTDSLSAGEKSGEGFRTEMAAKNEEVLTLRSQLASAKLEISQLESQNATLQSILQGKQAEIDQVTLKGEEQLKMALDKLNTANDTITTLQGTVELEKKLNREEITRLTAELAAHLSLTKELRTKLDQFAPLEAELTSMKEKNALLQEHNMKTTTGGDDDTTKALQEKVVSLAHVLGQTDAKYQQQIRQLQSELHMAKQLHLDFQKEHEEMINIYKTNQDKLLSQITTLVMSKTQLQQESEDLSMTISEIKSQYSQLLLKENDMADEIERLLEIVAAKDAEYEALSRDYNTINGKIVDFEAWYNNKDDLTQLTRALEAELAESNIELTAVRLERDELQMAIRSHQAQITQLTSSLKVQNEHVRNLQAQLGDMNGQQQPTPSKLTPNNTSITNHYIGTSSSSVLLPIKPSPQLTTSQQNQKVLKKLSDEGNVTTPNKGYVIKPMLSAITKPSEQSTPQLSTGTVTKQQQGEENAPITKTNRSWW